MTRTSKRLVSLDVLRGITVCGMILVNNAGACGYAYAPLKHAKWDGFTPADLVFPAFMFIMGVSIYLSLNKSNFDWRVSIARILRRTALIFVSGVALKWILAFIATGEYNTLENLRIMGVLQRLGICYGIVAILAVTVRHRLFPTIIAVLLVGYYLLQLFGNGLIEALLHTNAVLYILDPKNADLADLGTVMGNVYHTKEEMIDCVNAFYEGMVQRSEEMKRHPNYKTGENYAYLGLPPCFLIFDEYVAFFEMLGTKESVSLLSQLKKIVMLGRQAGYFLIVACQRPDAKYFSDGIRDNFNFRVGLGRISELGYGMLFGSDVKKQFFQKRIKGRGYCDVGTSVISEFYTPLVPKGHDFLQEIGRLEEKRTASNES